MSDPNLERKSLRKSSSRGSYREGNLGNLAELFSLLVLVAVVVIGVVVAVVLVVALVVVALEVVESSLKKLEESVSKNNLGLFLSASPACPDPTCDGDISLIRPGHQSQQNVRLSLEEEDDCHVVSEGGPQPRDLADPGVVLVVQDHQAVPPSPTSILSLRGELAAASEDEGQPGHLGPGEGGGWLVLSTVTTTQGGLGGHQLSRDLTT